jgi:cytidylate kinase
MSVITISRQSGSEGNQIARVLCEELDYSIFEKPLMMQLAAQLKREVTDGADQLPKARSLLERILNPFDSALEPGHEIHKEISFDEHSLPSVDQVSALIMAAYHHNNVVIVGRGSQVVLANKPDVLHVRIIAPLEKRIQTWMARDKLTYKDAEKRVHERDKAHVDFVKNFYDADVRNPELYDLVINTEKLSIIDAVDLIIQALHNIEPPGR